MLGAEPFAGREQPQSRPAVQAVERAGREGGRDDALQEGFGEDLGAGVVDLPVERDDRPEGAHRIGLARRAVGVGDGGRRGDSAGIGVLDDDGRRHVELQHGFVGGVRVEQVIEGELLAVQRLRELEEAAKVDGSTSWQTLRSIFLPLALPGIVTVGLFAFIASWNEFLSALIFMNKETSFTVPIMLVSVRTGRLGSVDWGALQAGVILSILPCVLIYLLLQKYYVAGFLNGAVK